MPYFFILTNLMLFKGTTQPLVLRPLPLFGIVYTQKKFGLWTFQTLFAAKTPKLHPVLIRVRPEKSSEWTPKKYQT